MNGPVPPPARSRIPSLADHVALLHGRTAEQKIQLFVELAITRCGSAAALARALNVSQPTVSEWRAGRKRPDAIKLIRIQDLAQTFESRT